MERMQAAGRKETGGRVLTSRDRRHGSTRTGIKAEEVMVMHNGETRLTTNPGSSINGDNGQFIVIDHHGNVEWYFCADNRIKLIKRDGVERDASVPVGQFLVEKISEKWV